MSATQTPLGIETLIGSFVPAHEDRAPDPVQVAAGHGKRRHHVTADELTGDAGPGVPRLSYLILPADAADGPAGTWDLEVVLPGQKHTYTQQLKALQGPAANLAMPFPPAVVYEDTEWIVWHNGVITSPHGTHIVATAAQRPGAPPFTDPWPRQPVRALFTHPNGTPVPDETGRTDPVPAFNAYTALTHTTTTTPTTPVIILNDPTHNTPLRIPLPHL
ncbi:hypothetical protein [Streptomyces sp. NPDC058486]|uniref:hypothetical protein n=1 Tax=unclassified Streptomyces TaxID=2593676 RepID=UPI0036599217